ncbi:MAG: hypothetical protein ACO1PZ_13620 [Gammaproteobacteria bacterium]
MQTLDVKAERLRQRLVDAAQQVAEFEHLQSFQIPVPDSDPPRFIAVGTREEIDAFVSDEGWQQLTPDDVDASTAAKLQHDPDSAPNA